jgi:Zn-dependent protease/predicted transcriptional regulator
MMLGKPIHLFTLFGFSIRIDYSWFFLLIIVTWSLATQAFPVWYHGLSSATYFIMGLIGAFGLFASIVLHELSHSVVARHHGVVMRGITLFIFGGVAEMTDEPPSARAEFQVAIAGPIMSIVIALVCFLVYLTGHNHGWSDAVNGVFAYTALINGVLVLFNMIPAFPLDGGRVLRAILWGRSRNLMNATRISSRIGVGFGFVLIGLGILRALTGDLIGGVWSFLIGMFLRGAANMSYRQLLMRQSFEGQTVRRFMKADPVTVPADTPLRTLVTDYVYRYHFKMFPVMNGDYLVGCITTRMIKDIPTDEWSNRTAGDVAERCNSDNSIGPDVPALAALMQMSRTGVSRLMVVDGAGLVGIITLKDLLQFLSLKTELEGDNS